MDEPPPQSAREGFEAVERLDILDSALAEQFRTTFVGFRHRLVHDYERLDSRIVYRTAQKLLTAGQQYIVAVGNYLTSQQQRRRL